MDLQITNNTNNHLIRLDFEKAEIPEAELGKSWDISQDGTRITFKLHEGVRFHDGQVLTCEDVQYSYQRVMDPRAGMLSPRKGSFGPVKSVSCPDAHTVVFDLQHPWPDALPNIADAFMIIYPKHVAQPKDEAGEFMKRTLIGSGPFVFKRSITGDILELEANPDYWKAGLPYLDGIQFFPIPEVRTWLSGFEAGRFDFMYQLDSAPLAKQAAEKAGNKWTIKEYPRTLFVNFVPDMKEGSIWRDLEIRKAAALAICHDEFLEVMGPLAFVRWMGALLPRTSIYALPLEELRQVPGYGTDCETERAQARQIFKEKAEGFELELRTWERVGAFRDSAVVVCDAFLKVGFKCTVRLLEQGPYYDMVGKRQIPTGMAVIHSIAITSPTPDAVLGQAFHPDGIRNYGDYDDLKLRDLFTKQSAELDVEKRKETLLEYQRYFLNQYYHVVMGWRGTGKGWWNYVQGAAIRATNPMAIFWPNNYEEVWFDK